MARLNSSDDHLESELARLYEQRLVVDELIKSLEHYAVLESKRSTTTENSVLGTAAVCPA